MCDNYFLWSNIDLLYSLHTKIYFSIYYAMVYTLIMITNVMVDNKAKSIHNTYIL